MIQTELQYLPESIVVIFLGKPLSDFAFSAIANHSVCSSAFNIHFPL
jgi:hypothetical protein